MRGSTKRPLAEFKTTTVPGTKFEPVIVAGITTGLLRTTVLGLMSVSVGTGLVIVMDDVAVCATPVFSTVMVTVPAAATRLAGKVATMLVPVMDVIVRGIRVCPLRLP